MMGIIYVLLIALFSVGSFFFGAYGIIPGVIFCICMSSFSGWQLGKWLAENGW